MSLIEMRARGCKMNLKGNGDFTLPDMSGLADDIGEVDLSFCGLPFWTKPGFKSETAAQVEVLINLRDSTGYEGWTKNKEGWDQLVAGMSGKQAKAIFKACDNWSVTFDAEGRPRRINLDESGLSGECPRFSSRHQSLIAHGNTPSFLAGPLPDVSSLTHLTDFSVNGNKCSGATMQIV